jgi:hypothetical protein
MAKYSRTMRTIIEHRACLNTYAEHTTFTSCVMDRLECENTLLHHGTCESTERDMELQVVYHRLSEAKHRLNYNRQQIDLARQDVDIRTHAIIHLENTVKTQDAELEDRAETIANL